ncbi:hypothetical protein [Clostridium sp. BNL1100]|nr:hypothetical protein [Clostridium sp. BNL1100]
MSNLSAEEKKIIETFVKVLPLLEERERDRLLWICEGILLKSKPREEENS